LLPQATGEEQMHYNYSLDLTGKEYIATGIRIQADPNGTNGGYCDPNDWARSHGLSEVIVTGALPTDYELYTSSVVGGTVNLDVPGVTSGGNALVTVTPFPGYNLEKLYINGVDRTGDLAGGELALANITEDTYISAVFNLQ